MNFCRQSDIIKNVKRETKSHFNKLKYREVNKMETLKSMLEKLTKLSRECRYLETKPGIDEGLRRLLWKHYCKKNF